MSNNLVFSPEELENADLLIDARYAGSRNGNASDDPLTRLLSLSNQEASESAEPARIRS